MDGLDMALLNANENVPHILTLTLNCLNNYPTRFSTAISDDA